jgi:hypothetical protein
MNALPDNIAAQIQNTGWTGAACNFVPLDDEWGIKAYRSERCRDTAYYNQCRFYEVDEAPRVGDTFEIGDWFCYATEVVVPLINEEELASLYDEDEEPLCDYDDYADDIRETKERLHEKGLYYYDDHEGNFGWLNGRLVVLDFDAC